MPEAFGESGILDQPRRGEFHVVARWEVRQVACDRSELLECASGNDGVHEKRAVTTRVGIIRVEHHSFPAADRDHRVPHSLKVVSRLTAFFQIFAQFRISDAGRAIPAKAKRYAEDDVPVLLAILEEAGAIF